MVSKLQKLVAEKAKRENLPNEILSAAFPQQREFILDPSRRKAAFVARRSGKSFMIGIYLLYTALTNPTAKCLYFGKTKDAASNVMWLHIIFNLCQRFGLEEGKDYKWNKNEKTVTFTNKSSIVLTGADANDSQIEKALGGKYKLVIFDECQVVRHDLERWIKFRLGPAMVDQAGVICMTGTAGDYMGNHFWYKVTTTDTVPEPGWSVYKWKWSDNIHMKDLIAKEIDELKALNPDIELEPGFRQEWLCEWVVETSGRIYKFDPVKNVLSDPDKLKSIHTDKEWRFIIGMDFGFEDDTALVVGAFSKFDPTCYIVDSFKKPKMLTQEVAETIQLWRNKYNPIYIVGDAQNKTLVETLKVQYRIPIVPAEKRGKEAHIAAMNSDFIMSKIKVLDTNNKALIQEWNELVWSENKRILGIYVENPTKDNHLADACLYLHHFSKHYRAIPKPVEDPTISPFRKQAEREMNHKTQHDIYDSMDVFNFVQSYKANQ
jgi:hypothetical protein